MNDLEQDLRELFASRANDVSVASPPGPNVLRRARRRQARTALAAAVLVTVLVAGTFVGVQALSNADLTRPGVTPPPSPVTGPVVVPEGRLAFVHGTAIYTIRPDGTGMEQVAACPPLPCEALWDFSWSPDGRRIAFSRDDPAAGTTDLWIVNADGTDLSKLTDCPGQTATGPRYARRPCYDTDPAWSPDGTTIAFTRNQQLHAVNADGSDLRRLESDLSASTPAWSPDGTRIAFAGSTARRDGVYVIDANGSDLRQLTDEPGGSGPGAPAWSPDGTRIAFFNTPRADGGFVGEVWVMDADGSGKERLYLSDCCVEDPAMPVWSPSGGKIAFVLGVGAGGELIVVRADGTQSEVLASADGGVSWR